MLKPNNKTVQVGLEYTQIIANAESELVSLARQIEQAQFHILTANSEISALDARQHAREQKLATAQGNVKEHQESHDIATQRAELAKGTLASKGGILLKKRHLSRAQTELENLEKQVGSEAHIDQEKRSAALQSLDTQTGNLESLLHKQQLTEQVKEQAQSELGQAIMNGHVEEFSERHKRIEALEQELVQEREDLDIWGRAAVESLAAYPALAATLVASLPFSDTTTEALNFAQELVTLLLERGRELADPTGWFLENAGLGRFQSLDSLLCLDASMVYPATRRTGNDPVGLQQRQTDLAKLLEAYVTSKRGQIA